MLCVLLDLLRFKDWTGGWVVVFDGEQLLEIWLCVCGGSGANELWVSDIIEGVCGGNCAGNCTDKLVLVTSKVVSSSNTDTLLKMLVVDFNMFGYVNFPYCAKTRIRLRQSKRKNIFLECHISGNMYLLCAQV